MRSCHLFLQPTRDNVDLPGALDLRPRPDLRLVRLSGRVPPLERPQETEGHGRAIRPLQVQVVM